MAHDFGSMTRRSLLGAIPALGLAGAAAAQIPGKTQTGTHLAVPGDDITSTLDAWVDVYGRPTAKVMLNGQGPFAFMVDTGSTTTVVAQRIVDKLAAPLIGMATVAGTTGTATTALARFDMVETGAVNKEDVRCAVLPDSGLSRADGILGADIFAGKRLFFNIQARIVRIEQTKKTVRAAQPQPNMSVRNGLLAEISGKVGNVNARLMLDTGAQNCICNMALSNALKVSMPRLTRVDEVDIVGVTGQVVTGQAIALPTVDVKAFQVRSAGAVAADVPIFKLWNLIDEPAMIVGVNLLSRLSNFAIDYGAKKFEATLMTDLMARNGMAFG